MNTQQQQQQEATSGNDPNILKAVHPTSDSTPSWEAGPGSPGQGLVDSELMMILPSREFHQQYDLVMNKDMQGGDQDGTSSAAGGCESMGHSPVSAQAPSVASSTSHVAMVGSGAFSNILLCTPKDNQHEGSSSSPKRKCVVKVLTSNCADLTSSGAVSNGLLGPNKDELAILQHIGRHPSLLPLLDCFPMQTSYFQQDSPTKDESSFGIRQHALVFPLVDGGDLFDEVGIHGAYPEQEAKTLLLGLLEGLAHIHSKGIAHRDIKPENILLVAPSANGATLVASNSDNSNCSSNTGRVRPTQAVLADFGLAGTVPAMDCCGSPMYAAPELLISTRKQQAYDCKVDLYSLGVVAYAVLTGGVPFVGTPEELFKHTLYTPAPFKARNGWDKVSPLATDFVRGLMAKEAKDRPSAEDAMHHAWFVGAEGAKAYRDAKEAKLHPPQQQQQNAQASPAVPIANVACSGQQQQQQHSPVMQTATTPKARTTSPTLPLPKANRDSTSDLTRAWYNKSHFESVARSLSSCSDGEGRVGSNSSCRLVPGGASPVPPPTFVKMGSVAGLSALYGTAGLCTSTNSFTAELAQTSAARLISEDSEEHRPQSGTSPRFFRQNSNSAPTLAAFSPTTNASTSASPGLYNNSTTTPLAGSGMEG